MSMLFASVTRKVRVLSVVLAASLPGGATLVHAQDVPVYPGVEALPDIPLVISDSYAPSTWMGAGVQVFVDYLTKASGGKIKPEVYWSGSLVTMPELAEAIASGVADVGLLSPIYDPASFPVANWITTLANQAGGGVPYGTEVFTGAHTEFVMTSPEVQKEFADRSLHILGAQTTQAFDLMCNKPVQTLADAKGKRVRTGGQVFAREAEALGMTPVPVPPLEMYEAFQRGIVDCLVLHAMGYLDFGVAGVDSDKYLTNPEFAGFNSLYFTINKQKWDAMPDLARQIINDAYAVLMRVQLNGMYQRFTDFGKMVEAGKVKTLQPGEDLVAALKAQQQAAIEGLAATAPAGLDTPQAVVDRYLGLVEKWRGIVGNELKQSPAPSEINAEVAAWAQPFDYGPFVQRLYAELAK